MISTTLEMLNSCQTSIYGNKINYKRKDIKFIRDIELAYFEVLISNLLGTEIEFSFIENV